MRYEDIWELYKDGGLEDFIGQIPDVDALDTIHSAMYENAQDVGLNKDQISRAMQNVNFEVGRKHMLDERDMAYLTRTSMSQLDKEVANEIMRGQIIGIAKLIEQKLAE